MSYQKQSKDNLFAHLRQNVKDSNSGLKIMVCESSTFKRIYPIMIASTLVLDMLFDFTMLEYVILVAHFIHPFYAKAQCAASSLLAVDIHISITQNGFSSKRAGLRQSVPGLGILTMSRCCFTAGHWVNPEVERIHSQSSQKNIALWAYFLDLAGDEGYKQCAVAASQPGIGRTRVEANHFQKKIKKYSPSGIFS